MQLNIVSGCLFFFATTLWGQDTIILPISGAGGFHNTCYATVWDNGIDTNYANFTNSTITIAPLWVESISLYFEEFETEVYFDKLNIYDGPGTTFPLIGSYSGTELDGQTIYSTGNAITLELITDDIVTKKGFKAWVGCIMGEEGFHYRDVRVFPNPAIDYLSLDVGTHLIDRIQIINSNGQIIRKEFNSQIISVSDLIPGIYYLLIYFQDIVPVQFKWVKQ